MTEREALLDCIAIVAGGGPATMADLASRYRLPVDAVWTLVQTLLERGMLVCGEPVRMKRGHPRGRRHRSLRSLIEVLEFNQGRIFLVEEPSLSANPLLPFLDKLINFG